MLKRIEDFEKSSRAMQKATYAITLKNKEMLLDLEKKVQKLVTQDSKWGALAALKLKRQSSKNLLSLGYGSMTATPKDVNV